jgi:AcrR family transcriptional regulator
MKQRKQPDVRKEEILAVALKQAQLHGIKSLRRDQIAAGCSVAESLLTHHFGTMPQLTRALVRYAIKHNNAIVVAQAVDMKHPAADDLPDQLASQVAIILSNHK